MESPVSSHNSTSVSIETEFPADLDVPTSTKGTVTGAFAEMNLNENSAPAVEEAEPAPRPSPQNVGMERPLTSAPIQFSVSSTPPQEESKRLMPENEWIGQPGPEEDEDDGIPGIIYKSTTIGDAAEPNNLMARLQQLYRDSSGTMNFIRNLSVFCGSLGEPWCWLGFYVLLSFYPFAMLIIGSLHLWHCPIQENIPVYLVVGGVFWLVKLSLRIYEELLSTSKQTSARNSLQKAVWWQVADSVVSVFLFAWFIAGCVWIYGALERRSADAEHPLYCDHTLYYFAFWTVTLQFILFGLILIGSFLLISCLMVREARTRTLS